ncbi:MAG: type VII secretion protein EssC [Oscillospiraceae bacterium]|nr:type VII secretion protein EssC [Oscillospiraceae bacterium]
MNFVLTVFTDHVYREFFLPELDNADHDLLLRATENILSEDLHIAMEVIDGQWYFKPMAGSQLLCDTGEAIGRPIRSGQIFRLVTAQGERLTIIVWEKPRQIQAYPKYAITGEGPISIGQSPGNDIACATLQLLSPHHAQIHFSGGKTYLKDLSTRGTYLGGQRITSQRELRFGDVINIFGLTIIYLDQILVVNSLSGDAVISSRHLRRISQFGATPPNLHDVVPTEAETVIHVAPRTIPRIYDGTEHIENIPAKREGDQRPAWMAVLPSLTMVLPMVLGFLMMGNGMATGIFISAGSALVGFTWAVINLRYSRKQLRQQELLRQARYGEYLVQCADRIREKFEHNRAVRQALYPPAEVCAGYTERSPELWARRKDHSDLLYLRLGLGEMPFQVNITAPKREFSLIEDELAERPGKIARSFQTMENVPVGVDLIRHHVVGILAGTERKRMDILRLLVAQLATGHCYTDVKTVFLYDANSKDAARWSFAKWLPHVWNEDRSMRYIGSTPNEINDVLYAVSQVLRIRAEQSDTTRKARPTPHYVVIASSPALLEGHPVCKFLYGSRPEELGVSTILLAELFTELPSECRVIAENGDEFSGIYGVGEEENFRTNIRFDHLSPEQLLAMAKRMTSMRVKELESSSNIPSSLTFFEMMQVQRLEDLQVIDHWRKNRTYKSMKALVGFKAGDQPCYLDIYEKSHGPHGLVAGTTGSGKSETLQTYILSLACRFSPQDVGFFIIDFKGGGMANLFSDLPHMMGQISNLSGNQVRRAMVSIKSENARRMRLFNEFGVNKIDDYVKLFKNGEAPQPLPHLLIVIDEFAELKREQPEFMKELISVAQVGRSLGVHLILATQKPNGTVDDNIWSNSKFKLCLRVADKQDSNDMLHKPDAAYLTQAGRCYLQVGNDEVFELFQSGWSGAAYDPDGGPGHAGAVLLDLQGRKAVVGNRAKSRKKIQAARQWMAQVAACVQTARAEAPAGQSQTELCHQIIALLDRDGEIYPDNAFNVKRIEEVLRMWPDHLSDPAEIGAYLLEQARDQDRKLPEPKERTQLDAVVAYLAEIADKYALRNQQKLWLPVLPEQLYLSSLDGFQSHSYRNGHWPNNEEGHHLRVHLGLVDAPEIQRQFPLEVDLAQNGHLVVTGAVTSGKSTLLQTLFYSLITHYSPRELQLYLIDFSSQMLSPFEKAPHVGGVVFEGEDEKLNKLFGLLSTILNERKQQIRGGSFSQYIRMHGHVLPAIVVGLDGYANFREKTEDRFEPRLMELLRDAEGYGIYLVISSSGFGGTELQSKLADKFRQGLCLDMGDKYKFAEVLRTSKFEVLPEPNIKGRGLALVDEVVLEFQTALALEAENDYRRAEAIERTCQEMGEAWSGRRARQIPQIPAKPTWELFHQSDVYQAARNDRHRLPVAYRQEDASAYCIDLRSGFCYLVLGQEQSGKSVFLRNVACAIADRGDKLYFIDRDAPVEQDTVAMTGAISVSTDRELFDMVKELILLTNERGAFRKELQKKGLEDDEIFDAMQKYPPVYYLIGDMDRFIQRLYTKLEGIGQLSSWLETIFAKGKLLNVYFIAAVNVQQTVSLSTQLAYQSFSRDRKGVLLGCSLNKQSVFNYQNVRSYHEQNKSLRPGQGWAVADTDPQDVDRIVIPQNRGVISS